MRPMRRTPWRRPNIAVARVEVADGRVVLVNADRAVSTHRWLSPRDAGAFTFSVPAEVGAGGCSLLRWACGVQGPPREQSSSAARQRHPAGRRSVVAAAHAAACGAGVACRGSLHACTPGAESGCAAACAASSRAWCACFGQAGYGVEADPAPPRVMGAPFAADLHPGHCYAILPGGQVRGIEHGVMSPCVGTAGAQMVPLQAGRRHPLRCAIQWACW